MPFLVFEIADLILAEKESFESRMIPKRLCSLTFNGYVIQGDYWMIYFMPFL